MQSPALELKRHCVALTPKEVDEVVDVVADLIVQFLQARGRRSPCGDAKKSGLTATNKGGMPWNR